MASTCDREKFRQPEDTSDEAESDGGGGFGIQSMPAMAGGAETAATGDGEPFASGDAGLEPRDRSSLTTIVAVAGTVCVLLLVMGSGYRYALRPGPKYVIVELRKRESGPLLMPTDSRDEPWCPCDTNTSLADYLRELVRVSCGFQWDDRIVSSVGSTVLLHHQAAIRAEYVSPCWDALLKPWGEQRKAYRAHYKCRHCPDLVFGVALRNAPELADAVGMSKLGKLEEDDADEEAPQEVSESTTAPSSAGSAGLEKWWRSIPVKNTFIEFPPRVLEEDKPPPRAASAPPAPRGPNAYQDPEIPSV